MRFKKNNRRFRPSKISKIVLKDCGKIILKNNEQVTFSNNSGKNNYDITKKNWGYYATPSINSRLKYNNLNSYIVKNKKTKRFFILLVEKGKKKQFIKYLKSENMVTIPWPKKIFE
jgi:hypothetical protein